MLGAGVLVVLGGALAEQVDAAMNVGVVGRVVVLQGVQHGARLLGGGGVVEIDERLAAHLLAQDGEVVADALHVEHRGLRRPGGPRGQNGNGRDAHHFSSLGSAGPRRAVNNV